MSDEGREPIVKSDNAEPPGDFHGGALAALFGVPSREQQVVKLRVAQATARRMELGNQRTSLINGVLAVIALAFIVAAMCAMAYGITYTVHAIAQLKW